MPLQIRPSVQDEAYQEFILAGVSRTFALTIPQLPPALRGVVANAYLLCRIADTVEDDNGLDSAQKTEFARRFCAVVDAAADAEGFSRDLSSRLSAASSPAEHDLIAHAASVIRITHNFNPTQRAALSRCIQIMSAGMAEFQRNANPGGLPTLAAMDRYCYCVAGVVGEMLTDLFCEYSPAIQRHQAELRRLAVSFGQALQMTNILKDIWEDARRGACWLPRDLFQQAGFDLSQLQAGQYQPAFGEGLAMLIEIAREHLRDALRYILLIPASETGIRRFCLWALGMAVLTLRKIDRKRDFSSGQQVKISRRNVKAVVWISNRLTRRDTLLQWLFRFYTKDLPTPPRLALPPGQPR
jgi:farnesyl-diphosphate farnesyltransferase